MPSAVVLSHDWIAHELGHLDPWLNRHDFTVTRIHREQPRELPPADLLIVMGSPGSVAGTQCPEPSVGEVDAIERWIAQGRAYLGICFGAQALARALGGGVQRMTTPFAGYSELDLAADAPPSLGGPWTIWHNDGIGASASTDRMGWHDHADLAIRSGRAWGLQPHIEVDGPILRRMLDSLGVHPDDAAPVVDVLESDETNPARAQALLDAFLADAFVHHP